MAKLSDFLLKVIWKHFKDVVTCSLILTLPWQPSFYSYVFSKITVLSWENIKVYWRISYLGGIEQSCWFIKRITVTDARAVCFSSLWVLITPFTAKMEISHTFATVVNGEHVVYCRFKNIATFSYGKVFASHDKTMITKIVKILFFQYWLAWDKMAMTSILGLGYWNIWALLGHGRLNAV